MIPELLMNPVLIWFTVGLAMFLLELVSPGLFIFFFGVGAWVVTLVCLLAKVSLNVQLGLFIVASILSLVLFRRILQKTFHGHLKDPQDLGQDLDDLLGRQAVVLEAIEPPRCGKVEFRGGVWEASAETAVPQGAQVEITGKDNITLKVKRI